VVLEEVSAGTRSSATLQVTVMVPGCALRVFNVALLPVAEISSALAE